MIKLAKHDGDPSNKHSEKFTYFELKKDDDTVKDNEDGEEEEG